MAEHRAQTTWRLGGMCARLDGASRGLEFKVLLVISQRAGFLFFFFNIVNHRGVYNNQSGIVNIYVDKTVPPRTEHIS